MQALQAAGTAWQYVLERAADGLLVGSLLLFCHEAASARAELSHVLGYTREGLLRQRRQVKGVVYDVAHWGLLAGELRPAAC